MNSHKPKMLLVTPENIHTYKPNPQSKYGVAKGDEEYEEMKEALKILIAKCLNVDTDKIK